MHGVVLLLLLLGLSPAPLAAQTAAPATGCSGAGPCKPAVRFLGESGSCACFSCDTGTPNEYRTCTRQQEEKKALFERTFQDRLKLKEQLERKAAPAK